VGLPLPRFPDRRQDLLLAQVGVHARDIEGRALSIHCPDDVFTAVSPLDSHLATFPGLIQDLSETLSGF
jgi:hypothetical protein